MEATHTVQYATQLSALCSSVKETDSFHCPHIGVVTGVDPLCLQYMCHCVMHRRPNDTPHCWALPVQRQCSAVATCLEIYCKRSKAVWQQLEILLLFGCLLRPSLGVWIWAAPVCRVEVLYLNDLIPMKHVLISSSRACWRWPGHDCNGRQLPFSWVCVLLFILETFNLKSSIDRGHGHLSLVRGDLRI